MPESSSEPECREKGGGGGGGGGRSVRLASEVCRFTDLRRESQYSEELTPFNTHTSSVDQECIEPAREHATAHVHYIDGEIQTWPSYSKYSRIHIWWESVKRMKMKRYVGVDDGVHLSEMTSTPK